MIAHKCSANEETCMDVLRRRAVVRAARFSIDDCLIAHCIQYTVPFVAKHQIDLTNPLLDHLDTCMVESICSYCTHQK